MHSSSGTSSSAKLSATLNTEPALSNSPAGHGRSRSGDTPPSSPRLDVPDSYWSRTVAQSNAELFFESSRINDVIARYQVQSSLGQDVLFEAIERAHEDRENDPRSRMDGVAVRINLRPIMVPDITLSPELLAKLLVLKDPEGLEPQPGSSTSSTSSAAAAATRQAAIAGGCCLPPGCSIL